VKIVVNCWLCSLLGARFFALAETGRGAHPAFYTMDMRSFPGRGFNHPPAHLVPRLKKE
jgi:hypothetical protein